MFSHPLLTLFSAPGSAGTAGPINTAIPVISGALTTGETLTTTDGSWLNSPTSFTYQWQRDGVDISAATANTHVLVSADVGTTITAIVTADGSASATSAGVVPIASYADRVLALTPIAYYQLAEASGTTATDSSGNAHDGTYVNAVPGGTGIGDGGTAATFDGTGDVVNIGAMAAAFNGDLGSVLVWGKTSAWADGITRILADIGGQVLIYKTTTLNTITFQRSDSNDDIIVNSSAGSGAYFSAGLTWSVAAHAMKAYLNGVQVGATQTGIAVVAGQASAALIGADTIGGADGWIGGIAHVAIFDRALSAAEMLSVGVV